MNSEVLLEQHRCSLGSHVLVLDLLALVAGKHMVIECQYYIFYQVEVLVETPEVSVHPKEPASICLHVQEATSGERWRLMLGRNDEEVRAIAD